MKQLRVFDNDLLILVGILYSYIVMFLKQNWMVSKVQGWMDDTFSNKITGLYFTEETNDICLVYLVLSNTLHKFQHTNAV